MPTYLKLPAYTAIFALVLIASVPRKEIRRLAIYGIIFGVITEIISLSLGKILGIYEYIDFLPLGYWVFPFFAPISWAIYFVIYFYFLPKHKPLIYVYIASGIGYSIFFAQLLFNSGIMVIYPKFLPYHYIRLIIPLIVFSIWFPYSTWGFLKLSSYFSSLKLSSFKRHNHLGSFRFILSPQPARKIQEEKRGQVRKPKKI